MEVGIIRLGLFFEFVVDQAECARADKLAQHRLGQGLELVVVVDVGVQAVHDVEVRVRREEFFHRRVLDAGIDIGGDEAREVGFLGEFGDIVERRWWRRLYFRSP